MSYLETASKYGFQVLFLALIGIKKDFQAVLDRYQLLTSHAKNLGYEICADVNPMKQRLHMQLSVRGDQSEYLIRSLESRMDRTEVESFHTVDIFPGDLLIDNKLYGQYAGEVQIALKNMKNSGRTNVVGHIIEEELDLLHYLKGGQAFGFQFI